MSTEPLVTIVIPARNEAADIAECIERVGEQEWPSSGLEVIVVDGGSTDGTRDVAARALEAAGLSRWSIVDNPAGSTPGNLNAGLREAAGTYVCRVDARTLVEPHHVRTCAGLLGSRPDVSVVGGAQVARARDASPLALGIARALNNRWSMGGSRYRRGSTSGPSDTVYLGAFRRADLLAVGGWDEALASNQDFDLNQRLRSRGTVWFEASLRSGYVPRQTLGQLWQQYRRFGRAKVLYWRRASRGPQARQWVLLVAPPAAVAAGALVLWSWPPRLSILAGLAGVVAALAVEETGTTGPDGGLGARLVALAAMSVVAIGWWTGVVSELVRPAASRRGSDLRARAS